MRRRYRGIALETGGTSINAKVAPGVKWLKGKGYFKGAETILDFGAGKYDRNATWLRKKGFRVYSYDPYNGAGYSDGWENVTMKLPTGHFDVAFSSYVLNVVPEHVEQNIVEKMARRADQSYHIVREDIFKVAKKALTGHCNTACQFFLDEFATEEEKEMYHAGKLTDEIILRFCEHGFETRDGFQRKCTSEDYGLDVTYYSRNRFKIYEV